ncbi:MAG: hypothetical protein VXY11_04880 [Candidatus Thermoplasmatota archaeon]|nr:hypothetical protein [Candidatus Thermoplasmatota archaeon]GIR00463.1 MAG: hypothetical protein CM15mP9_1660 [Euryarchaeota archaeon]
MRGRVKSAVLSVLLLGALSGCTFLDESDNGFDLNVEFDFSNNTIIETYSNGELETLSGVPIHFNFSNTAADLQLIGVDKNDGSDAVETSLDGGPTLTVNFLSHGKYNLSIYAVSKAGVKETLTTQIAIDLRILWFENSTSEPKPLDFNPIPENAGEHPVMIEIESEVSNPSFLNDFSGGQSVQFSWTITDELGDTCQRNDREVSDGDSEIWETIYFNTYLKHELGVVYNDGQDLIDIYHNVLITYQSE